MSKSPGNEKRPTTLRPLGVVSQMLSNKMNDMEQGAVKNSEALIVPLDRVMPNPSQPRQVVNAERDAELAANIEVNGVLEPIIVREVVEGEYEIIAGERRYRASLQLGLKTIPVIVKDYDDKQARLVSVVENLQRLDLDPLDEARYFQFLSNNYNYSYKQIGEMIHRSPTYVNDRIALLKNLTAGANDSEKNNNHSENERKLEKSQSKTSKEKTTPAKYTIKPLVTFDSWLNNTHHSLSHLKEEDKITLRGHLTDLRQKIAALEKELPDRPE